MNFVCFLLVEIFKNDYISFSNTLNRKDANIQKQPYIGVIVKRCSENMQQMYRRTAMSKGDFNHTLAWLLFCKFPAYFQNTFS